MSNVKKYSYQIDQQGDTWIAKITRKISSSKVVVSKQQDNFESEAASKTWAEAEIVNFSNTQVQRNQRQGSARKISEQTRVERSQRRAEKTANAKTAKNLNSTHEQDTEQAT